MLNFPPINIFDFLVYVPFCQENSSLRDILTLLRDSEHSFLVVTNKKLAPIGLIHRDDLQKHLANLLLSDPIISEFNLSCPIPNCVNTMIDIISTDMSIRDFLPLLQDNVQQVFIIIDSQARYRGVIDQYKLLKFLAEFKSSLLEQLINLENECQQLTARNIDLLEMLHWRNQLLSSWSHQLKSPVTALVALSNLLQEKKLGQLNERQSNYAQQIYHSSHQLMGLLSLTIDLTYVESGKLILKPKPIDIKSFCDELCKNLVSNISFIIEVNSDLKMMVADDFYLKQILSYLLKNALDFTPSDGQMGLRVEPWCNWVTFTVWHNGCGISEVNQPFLFEECQPLDNPLTGYFQGTGLELILSQRLAFAHGGDISFISQLEQGSEFAVLFPPVFPPSINQGIFYNSRLILIIDTNVSFIANLAKNLRELNYYVIVARTAIEAYRKAYQLKPKFIFLSDDLDISFDFTIFQLLKSDIVTKEMIIFKTHKKHDTTYLVEENSSQELAINAVNLGSVLSQYQDDTSKLKNLVLLLFAPLDQDFEFVFSRYASQFNYQVVSCNSFEQVAQVADLWSLDVIILDGRSSNYSMNYWLGLQNNPQLTDLPVISLDAQITSAINKMNGVNIFPYLGLSQGDDLKELFEVIKMVCQN